MVQPPDARGSKRIRLLIVDDMPDMAQNVQKLLHFERDIQVVGVASNGRDAIAKIESLHPSVVLMDINLRDTDGLKVTEQITKMMLPTTVVMMSVQSEPEYIQRAMMVGARGYLIKPFTSDDLVNTIRTAVATAVAPPQAAPPPPQIIYQNAGPQSLRKIIAVYSPKGGVGRSVIAANLAISLKRETEKRVILVDANLQSGDQHVILNVSSTNSIDDLREAGSLDRELLEGVVVTHDASHIGVLRAPVALESAELFTSDAMKAILVELREHFDYVVIDADTTFSEATLTVLEMADLILLVTTLEVTTINQVSQFFEVMQRLGYARSKVKLVCNRVDTVYGIQPKHVETRLHQHFLSQIPEDARLVITSVNRGVPFVQSHKAAPISRALQTLAQRAASLVEEPDSAGQEKRRWGFGR